MAKTRPFKVIIVGGGVAGLTLANMFEKHRYPMLFFDRQWLLKVLHDQIKQKDRILLQKRVQKTISGDHGVEVKTTNGESYFGSIIIGADGIHSTVRREMRRIAEETNPGYFPPGEEDKVPCYYQCSFGIAQKVQSFTAGNGMSFLAASGPEKRRYWGLFVKLPDVKYGRAIPKYTKKDDEAFAEEHRDRSRAPECLDRHEEQQPGGLDTPSTGELRSIFAKMQSSRFVRAKETVATSHDRQSLFAFENPLLPNIVWRVISPLAAEETPLQGLGDRIVGASRLKHILAPHLVPYDYELPAEAAEIIPSTLTFRF
ncbi:hypothetical protein F4810DRAFT_714030 [Camillea tinctor]|nr:hypothetical protein F4810DRAFT_714030 [Camillea tinctor]